MTRRRLATAAGVLVTAALAATATARAADTEGLTVAPFGSANVLLATSASGDVDEWTDGSSGWSGPTLVPGTTGLAASAPGANASDSGNQLNVFYLAADGGIGEAYEGSAMTWKPTLELKGTAGAAASAPAASPLGADDYVLYEGTDGALHASIYDSTTKWTAAVVPQTVGTIVSAPTVTGYDSGKELEVFYEDTDGGLDQVTYTSADGWTTPVEVPGTAGTLASAPAATTSAGGTLLQVFYETTAGTLDKIGSNASGAWKTAPVAVPGTAGIATGTPAADAYPSGQLDAIYRTAAGGIDQSAYTSSTGWTQSQVYVPPTVATPAPTPSPAPTPPTPTPTPDPVRRPVAVNITMRWTYTRHGLALTRLRHAGIAHFPGDARITVRGRGPGTGPFKLVAHHTDLAALWRKLERRRFRPGDRITFTITRPGKLAERGTLLVRRRAAPRFINGGTGR